MNIKFNIKKLFGVRGVSFVLAIAALPAMLTGCGKKADCDISGKHAHLYRSTSGYVRYIDKEYLTYEGYDRQDDYISKPKSLVLDYTYVIKTIEMAMDNIQIQPVLSRIEMKI